MPTFNDFVQTELPLRPFTATDGAAGQKLARSTNPLAARELVWVDDSATVQITAESALGGHRVVLVNPATGKLVYADKDTPTHVNNIVGMTTGAVAADAVASVLYSGTIDEPSWTWALNQPVYLGNSGLLTQTLPTTGFIFIFGVPLLATRLLLTRQSPVVLI